ncbi:MAG: DUF2147 domain-containing protein [Candidatus Hydrogenedentes bacterium]|nr:DUF2147 domain-containing protein [Candidatus Hydrogenedentota bacterium]
MNIRLTVLVVSILLGMVAHADGTEANAIVGQWFTSEKDARIEIFKVNGKYNGKIVWTKEPTYPEDDPESGKPTHDRENPDVTKRGQPLLGLTLLANFEYAGGNSWTHGTLYNPEDGNTYKTRLSLTPEGTLKVRGYLGISLLGRTVVWTRYEEPVKAQKDK